MGNAFRKTWTPVTQHLPENGVANPVPQTEKLPSGRFRFTITLLSVQCVFIVLFACFVRYDQSILGGLSRPSVVDSNSSEIGKQALNLSLVDELAEEELYPVSVRKQHEIVENDIEDSGSGDEAIVNDSHVRPLPIIKKKLFKEMGKKRSFSHKPNKREIRAEDAYKDEKSNSSSSRKDIHADTIYPLFQDVHVMIFVGFGFLMTFLKKYGYSAVGVNMLLAAIVLQWATLCQGFFELHGGKIMINITTLLNADFASATVLISFGALLGKTSPLQLLIMSLIEIVVFAANEWVGLHVFGASDVGASVLVHVFGAYFGLMVSFVLHNRDVHETNKEGANYHSDIFAMIGTIFLWLFWPSFNAALAPGHAQHRVVINTYYSLAACCVTTYAISAIVDKHNRFNMVHVQNSTLAGGVAIGTAADLMVQPFGAMIVGVVAAIVSVFGYHFITPFLTNRLKIHDTCGVHNLHGMPGVLAGIIGAIMAATASEEQYGNSLYEQYPMRAPANNTDALFAIKNELSRVDPGEGWSAQKQAGYQIITLVTTLAVAIVGGLITGLILRIPFFDPLSADQLFDDEDFWEIPEEEQVTQPAHVSTIHTSNSKQADSKNSTNGAKDELMNMAVF